MIILKEPKLTGGVTTHKGKKFPEVDKGWGLDFDDMNIILYQLGIAEKDNSVTKQASGYYSTVSACLTGLLNKQVLLTGGEAETLLQIKQKQEEFTKEMWKHITTLIKQHKASVGVIE